MGRPTLGRCRPKRANLGQIRPNFGQLGLAGAVIRFTPRACELPLVAEANGYWPNLGSMLPSCGPTPAGVGPNSAEVDKHWANAGQIWTAHGPKTRRHSHTIHPRSLCELPKLPELSPGFIKLGGQSARAWFSHGIYDMDVSFCPVMLHVMGAKAKTCWPNLGRIRARWT